MVNIIQIQMDVPICNKNIFQNFILVDDLWLINKYLTCINLLLKLTVFNIKKLFRCYFAKIEPHNLINTAILIKKQPLLSITKAGLPLYQVSGWTVPQYLKCVSIQLLLKTCQLKYCASIKKIPDRLLQPKSYETLVKNSDFYGLA